MLGPLKRLLGSPNFEGADDRARPRIGLITPYAIRKGMTTLARLYEYCLDGAAEVFPARKLTRLDESFSKARADSVNGELRHRRVAPEGMRLRDFIARQDILITVERPQPRLFRALKEQGKIVMLDVVLDWAPGEHKDRLAQYRDVDQFLVHTKQAREVLAAEYERVADLGPAHFWPVRNPKPLGSPTRFYFNIGVGGALDRRNVPMTIELFNELLEEDSEARLVLKMLPRARKYLTELPITHPRIELIERELSTAEMVELQSGMDVTLFPSRFEGFGFPLFESLHCGVPVITTGAAPMSEFIEPGRNGLHIDCTLAGQFGLQNVWDLDRDSYRSQIRSLLGPEGRVRLAAMKARAGEGLREMQEHCISRTQELMAEAWELHRRA